MGNARLRTSWLIVGIALSCLPLAKQIVQPNDETRDPQAIRENLKNLMDSVSGNNQAEVKKYENILAREAAREKQAFDLMKEQFRSSWHRNTKWRHSRTDTNSVVLKREAKQSTVVPKMEKTNMSQRIRKTKKKTDQSSSNTNSSTISMRNSSEIQSNYRLKPSDYLRIRTGDLGPDKKDPDRPILLTVNTRDIDIFNVTDEDITYLHSITDTAYFAHNDKKVTDVSYRNSKYTKTFQLSLNFQELQTSLGISEMVIQPYKLNLYTKGSFFKVHRDTHLPGLVATLILILPTTYTGGEIRFGDFYPETTMDKSKLRFIYFDIGVEHSISEVTSGHRISLVYNVLNPFQISKSTVNFHKVPEEVYQDLLREAIEFCKDKKNILFGQDKYRNDIFHRLFNDLEKQFTIIEVGVESHCYNQVTHDVHDIDVVYDIESRTELEDDWGAHNCPVNGDDSSSYCELKHMVGGKYKVKHKLFPLSTALRENSMKHVTAFGKGPPEDCSPFDIKYYAAFLINPSRRQKTAWGNDDY